MTQTLNQYATMQFFDEEQTRKYSKWEKEKDENIVEPMIILR